MTSIRLPEDLEARLNSLAKLTKRSKSSHIKEALVEYLEDLEDKLAIMEHMADPNPVYYTTKEVLENIRAHRKNSKK